MWINMRFITLVALALCTACSPSAAVPDEKRTSKPSGSSTMTTNESKVLESEKKSDIIGFIYRVFSFTDEQRFDRYFSFKPTYVRITKNLIFAIPTNHWRFWRHPRDLHYELLPESKIPFKNVTGFSMFLPGFGGYTKENFSNEFHVDRIDVSFEPIFPDEYRRAPATYSDVEAILANWQKFNRYTSDFDSPKEMYGMTCYRQKFAAYDAYRCIGTRSNGEKLLADIDQAPDVNGWPPNPRVALKYFTKEFGGTEVKINFSQKHAARWREIDDDVWIKIKQWLKS